MTTKEIVQEILAGGGELAVSLSLCFLAVATGIVLMRLDWGSLAGLRHSAAAAFDRIEEATNRLFRAGLLIALGFGACVVCQINGLAASPAPAIETEDCGRVRQDYANLLDSLGNTPKLARR